MQSETSNSPDLLEAEEAVQLLQLRMSSHCHKTILTNTGACDSMYLDFFLNGI